MYFVYKIDVNLIKTAKILKFDFQTKVLVYKF